ncbi:BMP family lipoprotein [Streptomyces clavuligerus]|uniref:BMP family lipoprotein n=1 Tax=Streptomyces clavuligerus TaxID=1901 RepID=UPI00017FFE42|nr:BMP family ABC transporter substrate-binding protein [Streptomyces clavuligerus]ANW18495.1 BMP family ABC transporter substrate-binding protein [Streptomyces clavuligerus]AXU13051.1 BMP family ABC transporter substrate-binding protein [Streptomyces clavuligerus]EDY49454.1 lipoprotein [Streptomyces clavuligerus]MBY6302987.1 BMP family ABC transporter substrate-binding protein [Streptomyces clavuligerus]QCS05834.1 BMP family ABC transporter substrate-binding protein [Streptomyces clavuligerus
MRRVSKITAACIATAALAFTATACGESSTEDTGSGSGDAAGKLKIGMAYDVGGRGDNSFNDSAARGLDKAKAELGAETKELTAKHGETPADREARLASLAKGGFNPVFAVGFAYKDAVDKVAVQFPKTTFGMVDSISEHKNVDSIVFAEEQGSYLAGVAAALKSKDGKVGFIGGVDLPLIKKFAAGFEQGVLDTNPKAKVQLQYLSYGTDLSGFGSPDRGRAAAQGMLDKGMDVIYTAAGGSGAGAIEAVAGKKGAWSIGVDSDQAKDPALAKYASTILTSVVKNVDAGVFALAKSVKDGKPLTGTHAYTLAEDGVSLTTTGGHLKDIQGKIDEAKKKIIDGQIKVKTTT